MKFTLNKLIIPITSLLIVIILCGSYYHNSKSEGFAIYLTRGDEPTPLNTSFGVVTVDPPIIPLRDIEYYNAQTHEIKLTHTAYERIKQLRVPVEGRPFVVCVDKKPIYGGAFWTPVSSIAFSGVTVWKPYATQDDRILTFDLGYPDSSFYGGVDPRNDARILDSLDKAGKLMQKLTLANVVNLPHSMKGYELYSWVDGGQWHFTLVSGTNRVKTLAEISSGEDYVSEAGWVNVQVVGVDAVKMALAKVPAGESVFWLSFSKVGAVDGGVVFQLPPVLIVDDIRDLAVRCGLKLSISS